MLWLAGLLAPLFLDTENELKDSSTVNYTVELFLIIKVSTF